MGILFDLEKQFDESVSRRLEFENGQIGGWFIMIGCVIYFSIIRTKLDDKDNVFEFGFISFNYFLKISFKFGIYFSIGFILLLTTGIISLVTGKNYIKKIFKKINCKLYEKKRFHFIIIISIIDIVNSYILNRLVSKFTIVDLITDYFTEPIYLLYVFLFYYLFKHYNFRIKPILSSFVFFIIGMVLMIFGLVKYYCYSTKINDETKCESGINNYFRNYHYSIIIAVLVIPFLFFLRMLLSASYMEYTNTYALFYTFQIYFFEFILSLLIYLISNKVIYKDDTYSGNYIFWLVYAIVTDLYELIIYFILRKSNLFIVFMVLVFNKLGFHFSLISNKGTYLYFFAAPIIFNIVGIITLSFQADLKYLHAFQSPINPLYIKKKIRINSDIILEDNESDISNNDKEGNNMTESNDNTISTLLDNKETKYINKIEKLENENDRLKNENDILKTENNELKNKNQNLNIKIGTLKVKIENLEELNEKLSEKIAILKDKSNLNIDDLNELDNI